MSSFVSVIRKYERHLSAVSMVAGFAFDNYYFGRVDHPATQIVLFAYLMVALGAILFVHFVESHADSDSILQKAHPLLVAATQFALGGLWSAFLIFYGRSAVTAASWPFLLVLAAMLVGNEMFAKYRVRLAFTCTLLFFALFSYAIFIVPVVSGSMGRSMFALSGTLALIGFVAFLAMLWAIGPEKIRGAWRGIGFGALSVFGILNLFYFTNVLPPLPLALAHAGVFHSVTKVGDTYEVTAEVQPSTALLGGIAPTMHVARGGSLYVYAAVFAPIQLKTEVIHTWRRYDDTQERWVTESRVRFPITGGREGGYRGYSIKATPKTGRWRVDISTPEGLLIGRVPFTVALESRTAQRELQVLK